MINPNLSCASAATLHTNLLRFIESAIDDEPLQDQQDQIWDILSLLEPIDRTVPQTWLRRRACGMRRLFTFL